MLMTLCLGVLTPLLCEAQIDAAQPSSELRSQMTAQKPAESAPAPSEKPAANAVPAAAATSAPAPAPTGLAGLLGPTTLSGFVDVYYDYNSNQPASRTTALRNFDINSSQFGLNMLELIADKPADATNRAGYHISLGFGQAMNLVNSTEVGPGGTTTNFAQYLKEGYLEYMAPVGKGLQINVGKFVTPNGAEVIETKDNWNYSRSFLFSWAIPYFHFGVSAKYPFNDKHALTAYLVNGWNNSVDNNSGKLIGLSYAWTPNKKFSFFENYMGGPEHNNLNSEWKQLFDTVVTYSPTAKLSFTGNYDYGYDRFVDTTTVPPILGPRAHWDGIAGYIKYAFNDKWTIATRGEWYDDHDGFTTQAVAQGTRLRLSEFTFTLQRMLASKIISRLEFRRDMSDQNVFPYRAGQFRDNQNTVTVGLVYAFSSADAK